MSLKPSKNGDSRDLYPRYYISGQEDIIQEFKLPYRHETRYIVVRRKRQYGDSNLVP